MKYVIITPAKDEAEFISKTIESVINQTLKPVEWIIVDDYSKDATNEIVKSYALKHKMIKVIQTSDNRDRSGGSKVVDAFYNGLEVKETKDYDFLVKLDADLILPTDYFEKIAECFQQNPKIGLCGGYCINEVNGVFEREVSASYHIRGAFKSVRRECFEAIGGFKRIWFWDGVDEMEAMYKGWETKVLEIPVIHLRPTTAVYNKREHAYKSGYESFKMGNTVLLALIRTGFKFFYKPYFIYGYYYLKGFIKAKLKNEDKYFDDDFNSFTRNFHYRRILNMKRL